MKPLHQHQHPASRLLLLPPDLPLPKYHFGQQVQWEQRYGTIRGLQYFTPRMSASITRNLDWVGWWYLIELDLTCSHGSDLQDVHEDELELREGTPCTA